jgi:hypothetical protein
MKVYGLLTAFVVLGNLPAPAILLAAPAQLPAPEDEVLTERQNSLLLQLSDAEANIKALNLALVRTGYKVGLAYDRIDSNEKGNELMDRNGGGPVRWDRFYGRTAKEYNRNGGSFDQRSQQFSFVYNANNQQIAKAKASVAALAQDQATLLGRRRQHEADQCYLWATLAWERVKDREIAFHPLYRFKLKPAGARSELLRGPILFLRKAEKVTTSALESVQSEQDGTFQEVAQQMKAAYGALQESMANSMLAAEIKDGDRKNAGELKSLCKQLSEQCAIIADNSCKALDSDRSNEDASKLQFRGELQTSLMKFATSMAELDERIDKSAHALVIIPEIGVASPDQLTDGPPKAGSVSDSSGVADTSAASRTPGVAIGTGKGLHHSTAKMIDLLDHVDPAHDPIRGKWALANGELRALHWDTDHGPFIELPVEPKGSYTLHMDFEFLNGTDALYVRVPVADTWGLIAVGHQRQTLENVRGLGAVGGSHALQPGRHHLELSVTQTGSTDVNIAVSVDKQSLITWDGAASRVENGGEVWSTPDASAFAIGCKAAVFRKITLEMTSGDAKILSK